jgi:hypothetical protein
LLDQIGSVFDRAERARNEADEVILAQAPNSALPKGMKSADVLKMAREKQVPIIAKARAELARRALADIAGADLILPQEISTRLADTVDMIKTATKGWVAGASQDEAAYKKALNDFDLAGLDKQQEYMVAAAANKREAATNAAIEEAGLADEGQLELAPLFRPPKEEDTEPDQGSAPDPEMVAAATK